MNASLIYAAYRARSRWIMGLKFEGQIMHVWAYHRSVHVSFIRPGKPNDNAYIERFNGKFRDECLNEHCFLSIAHAREVIEASRIEYNVDRTHSRFSDITPKEFAQQIAAKQSPHVSSTADSNPVRY